MAVKKNNTAIKNSPKHLLGIQNLSILEAKSILDEAKKFIELNRSCLLYTSPSPRDKRQSRMPSSA